jgi:hypothetical protein
MGEKVTSAAYTPEQRRRYGEKMHQDLDVFKQMLDQRRFDFRRPLTGLEIELNLVDRNYQPSMSNAEVLARIADPGFQTEIGQYNIELNVNPRPMPGDAALELEADLRVSLNRAETLANETGAHIVMIGILPTVMPEHFNTEWMSAELRYATLNRAMVDARGEDILISIEGASGESLVMYSDSIGPESACTSVQLHLQVAPHEFAAHWNAAQALSGPQLAVGANSPYFCGKQLWHETRIELFSQATDTRSNELKNQGAPPRVFFGRRWIDSAAELFEENLEYFPPLLFQTTDEDPVAILEAGQTPSLSELRLHNGTVYRWNRPVYDVADGLPHLRVENRVLPAGPTILDTMADSAFYYGTLRMLAQGEPAIWTVMDFATAQENFLACARFGAGARVRWPGFGELSALDLVLRHLLPMAHEGLQQLGVSTAVRERYLGVIEARCIAGVNGASWQIEAVRRLEERGADRVTALQVMLQHYVKAMHTNEPVHTWPWP